MMSVTRNDVTNSIVRTCYAADPWGGYGMDWFDAMQCCYFQNSYLAEPQNQEETDKINTYLTISTGGDRANTWWMGATDMHHEGGWVWMSGNPWSYENWNEGEPNQNGNERVDLGFNCKN